MRSVHRSGAVEPGAVEARMFEIIRITVQSQSFESQSFAYIVETTPQAT